MDNNAFLFAPGAECNDSCAHLVYFLRESQVKRGGATEYRYSVPFGVLALIDDHGEDSFGAEKFADDATRFVGMVFGKVRIAAEFLENVTESRVADGVCNEVYVFAVAAKAAVHELESALVDADACDGGVCFGTFCNRIANDVLVFVHDSFFNALETGESAIRF